MTEPRYPSITWMHASIPRTLAERSFRRSGGDHQGFDLLGKALLIKNEKNIPQNGIESRQEK
ncbi:hypothetical protein OAJ92_01425, partial [bacterium]|nr:hypothetical protein [bacterium]